MEDKEAVLDAKKLHQEFDFPLGRVYEMMNRADFPTIKIGNRKYVLRSRFLDWLHSQENTNRD